MTSVYFTVTTITTVGFGDITPGTENEKLYLIFLMIVGVVSFSFATGSLSSILANLDSHNAIFKEKVAVLDQIREKYDINPLVHDEIMQAIHYQSEMDKSNIMDFI